MNLYTFACFCSCTAKTRWSSIFCHETGQRISGSAALSIMRFSAVTRRSIIPSDVGQEVESSVEAPRSGTGSSLPDCIVGSRPSDHYFRCVCLSVCLFVSAELFSAVFDPISIKLGHMLYVWV